MRSDSNSVFVTKHPCYRRPHTSDGGLRLEDNQLNILIYMEPWIEKNDPTYRTNSFLVDQMRIVNAFRAGNPQCVIKALVGDGVALTGGQRFEQARSAVDVGVVSQSELKRIIPNYKDAARANYHGTLTASQLSEMRHLFASKLGIFEPDVIFAFESATEHLRKMFPHAVVITQYFSPFSREPFPRLHVFDNSGIFKSAITSFRPEDFQLDAEAKSATFVPKFRFRYLDEILGNHDPVESLLKRYDGQFEYLLLLPLQGSNYFAFEENSKSLDLFDLICDTLDRIDPRIGVVVTEHTARERVVSDKNLHFLRARYSNFIYIEDLNEIKFHSQFLLRHVDAVASVSSSVAFLGALAGLHVFNVGKFQSFVSRSDSVEDIFPILQNERPKEFDKFFEFLFAHVYVPDTLTRNSDFLFHYLNKLISLTRDGSKGLQCYSFLSSVRSLDMDVLLGDREKKMSESLEAIGVDIAPPKKLASSEVETALSTTTIKKIIRDSAQPVVSFDLFDTLVVRPFHRPRGLFTLIEGQVREILQMEKFEFARRRGRAEKDLRQKKRRATGHWDEVTLAEVYDELAATSGWSEVERDAIMALEIDAEVAVIRPRDMMVDVYKFALERGKKVIITTDTYLPKEAIERMLAKCGIAPCSHLFVSSSYGLRKQDGRLFDKVLEELQLPGSSIIHIGDNPEPDGLEASAKGLKPIIFRSANDRFVSPGGRIDLVWEDRDESLPSSIALAITSSVFDRRADVKPIGKSSLFNGDAKLLGTHALGPLLLEFARWLHATARRERYKHLYFLSREGLLFQRAYQIVAEHEGGGPECSYLRASRRSALAAAIWSIDDVARLVFKKMTATSLRHILEYKLGFNNAERFASQVVASGFNDLDQVIDLGRERQKLMRFFETTREEIIAHAHDERLSMTAYLTREGLTSETAKSSALVDVGYAGTIQRQIGRILGETPNGLYIGTTSDIRALDKINVRSDAFLFSDIDLSRNDTSGRYHDYVSVYEALLCAPEPSFKRAITKPDGSIELEFNDESITPGHATLVSEIHEGALEFIREAYRFFPEGIPVHFEKNQILKVTNSFFASPPYKDARLLAPITFDNKMGDGRDKMLLPNSKADVRSAILSGSVETFARNFVWKEGLDAVLKKAFEELPDQRKVSNLSNFSALI